MEVVVLWLGAGAIVGWLANQIMVKDSYGTQTDLIIGAVGGLIGGVLFPQFGFLLGGGYLGHIVNPTIGAVIGPNLVDVMGDVAERMGIPHLAGPFLLSGAAYLCGGLIVTLFLRPDPLLVARGRQLSASTREEVESPHAPTGDMRTIGLATASMVVAQLVMLAVMTMTPVHMRDHGHSLGAAGFVISLHIAAMFLPSPLTGILVDRLGRRIMIACGGATLCAAGLVAALAPPESMPGMAISAICAALPSVYSGGLNCTGIAGGSTVPRSRGSTSMMAVGSRFP